MGRHVVLVDHGSRREQANATTEELAADLAARLGVPVTATHMELAPPPFGETLRRLAGDPSVEELVVLPLFFSRGKHWVEDIETPVADLRRDHPELAVRMLPPLAEMGAFVGYLAAAVEAPPERV